MKAEAAPTGIKQEDSEEPTESATSTERPPSRSWIAVPIKQEEGAECMVKQESDAPENDLPDAANQHELEVSASKKRKEQDGPHQALEGQTIATPPRATKKQRSALVSPAATRPGDPSYASSNANEGEGAAMTDEASYWREKFRELQRDAANERTESAKQQNEKDQQLLAMSKNLAQYQDHCMALHKRIEKLQMEKGSERQQVCPEAGKAKTIDEAQEKSKRMARRIFSPPKGYRGMLEESKLQRSVALSQLQINRHRKQLGLTAWFQYWGGAMAEQGKVSHLLLDHRYCQLPYSESQTMKFWMPDSTNQHRLQALMLLNPNKHHQQPAVPTFWIEQKKDAGLSFLFRYVGHFRCLYFDTLQNTEYNGKRREALLGFEFERFDRKLAERMASIAKRRRESEKTSQLLCNCNESARIKTISNRSDKNPGSKYYACGRKKNRCDFFVLCDEDGVSVNDFDDRSQPFIVDASNDVSNGTYRFNVDDSAAERSLAKSLKRGLKALR